VDLDRRLAVRRGREDLRLARRDGRVPLDQRGAHAAERLDAEGQRRDVEQEHVFDIPGEHAPLDGRTDGDDLVRIHPPVRVAAEELAHGFLHLGDPDRPADQDDLVDVRGGKLRVLQRLLAGADGPLDEVVHELLELRAREREVQVLRPARVGRHVRQVDVGLLHRGELALRLLRRLAHALQRHRVLAQVDAIGAEELLRDPLDDPLVEVVAAKVRVAVGGTHLEDAVPELEDRDVERPAAEVVDGDLAVRLPLVEAVGERRGGRLVDDALDLETGDAAGVLGRLALRVVEVRRYGDDGLGHLFAEVVLRRLAHLLQNLGRDFRRREDAVADADARIPVFAAHDLVGDLRALGPDLFVLAAHEPLDGEDRVPRIGHGLPLGHGPHQLLAVFLEADDGGGGPASLGVRDDDGLPAFHDGDAGVGRSQIDSYDLAHCLPPLCPLPSKVRPSDPAQRRPDPPNKGRAAIPPRNAA